MINPHLIKAQFDKEGHSIIFACPDQLTESAKPLIGHITSEYQKTMEKLESLAKVAGLKIEIKTILVFKES